jgi:uncharacterized paraquat-inducible protein A
MSPPSDRAVPSGRDGDWRLRARGESARCRACGTSHPEDDLDDAGGCASCQTELARKTRWAPHAIAAAITSPFAVWTLLGGRFEVLPSSAWLLPLAAAYYLGYRIGREVVRGYARWRRAKPEPFG